MPAPSSHALPLRELTRAQGYVAYLRVRPRDRELPPDAEAWLDACYQLTERVEHVAGGRAFLDLGVCTEGEALTAVRRLMRRLRQVEWSVQAGMGPSLCLAQLVARTARPRRPQGPLALVAPDAADGFLRLMPVALLPRLHPAGTVSAEVVERLQRYGLPTLRPLARPRAPAPRRQFGAAPRSVLVRPARG